MTDVARRLAKAWFALMGLTLVLAIAADPLHEAGLGLVGLLAIAAAATLKARIILRDYLGLRASPPALAGFTTAVGATLALVALSFVATLALRR